MCIRDSPGKIALAEVHLFRGEGKGDVLAVVGVHIGEKLLHFLQHVGTAVPGGFRGLPGKNSPKPVPERAERRGDDLLVVGLLGSKLCMGRLKKICKFPGEPPVLQHFCRDQRVGKVGMAVEGAYHTGVKNKKIQFIFHLRGIAVMDVAGVDENQISCPGCEVVFIDAETGRAGAQVDQLDLLVPVGQEADVCLLYTSGN